MAKRPPESNRRKLIEEQRKKARSQERRKTILTIVISAIVGIGLIGASVYFGMQGGGGLTETALRNVGVTAELAACDEPHAEDIPKEAQDDAVKHTNDRVEYPVVPPSSGRHNTQWLPVGKRFYSRTDAPPPERAVHNLEHGYVVVWYDSKVTEEQVQQLEQAAEGAEGKMLFIPWTRGDFAGDKHIVLTSWAQKQSCGEVSGEAIQKFQDDFGGLKSKAPEKTAP